MKRKTTRSLLVLLMMLSLCFLCVACGGDDGSKESAKSSTTSHQNNPNEGLGGDISVNNEELVDEVGLYEGFWLSDITNQYDFDYLSIDAQGNWQMYFDGEVKDEGYLWYDSGNDITYIESYQDGAIGGGQVEMDGAQLYISTLGYLSRYNSEDDWYSDDDNGTSSYIRDPELYQRDVSELEGVWYYDEDFSATTYIVIDGYGNWSYYQRTSGDAEGTEMDYGTFSYSTDEVGTYYADSAMYDGISIKVFDFDYDTLIWGDEGAYYRMENSWYGDDDNGDSFYSWDSELCQRNVSEFEGVWYYDEDRSATTYIVIDGDGNWSYYERTSGDAEGTEMDYGTLAYSADEVSTYYADSAVYGDVSFRVFELDEDVLVWGDEGTYYRMKW